MPDIMKYATNYYYILGINVISITPYDKSEKVIGKGIKY